MDIAAIGQPNCRVGFSPPTPADKHRWAEAHPTTKVLKVFWFFFSKKNALPWSAY
jgi:hypothetical protein